MQARRIKQTDHFVVPTPPFVSSNVFKVTDYGAVADGVTDSRAAIEQTFAAANAAGGGIVLFPNGPVAVSFSGGDGDGIWTYANIVIRGTGPASEVRAFATNNKFHPVFNLGGDGIRFESIILTRANEMYGVMMNNSARSRVWLYKTTINGNKTAFPNTIFHGMALSGDTGLSMTDLNLVDSTFTDCDFVVYEGETTGIIITGIRVIGCRFIGNHASDLEFNSPAGTCTDVLVTRCHFLDSKCDGAAAGFGVGLANIQKVEISWCTFTNYPINPVHIESRSANVRITRCIFENFSTSSAVASFPAAIVIFGGNTIAPHEITIDNCRFDTTKQTTSTWCIYMGQAGATYAPYTITAINNVHVINPNAADDSKNSTPYYQEQLSGLVLSPNATMTASP